MPATSSRTRIPVTLVTGLSRQRQDDADQRRAAGAGDGAHRRRGQRVRRGRPRSRSSSPRSNDTRRRAGERLPLLHRARRPRRHAQRAVTMPGEAGRIPRFRQCRHRNLGPRRAGPGAAGLPVRADARRALPRRRRRHAGRCRELAPTRPSAHDEAVRQVALADQILITKLDSRHERGTAEALVRRRARRPQSGGRRSAVVDWTPGPIAALLTAEGFDAADPTADPRPWLRLAGVRQARAMARS